MAAPPSDSGALDPDSVARHEFTTTFRGFDQVEVRAFLNKVAGELRSARSRADDLSARLSDVEARLSAAEEPDEQRLTSMLGEETARILDAAREAATEIRSKAEAKTAELVREAQDEANRMTAEASDMLRTRTAEADEAAAAVRDEASADAERVRSEAAEEAERVTSEAAQAAEELRTRSEIEAETLTTSAEAEATRIVERATEEAETLVTEATVTAERLTTEAAEVKEAADAEASEVVDAARTQGREMVAEAQVVRERILTDLARRRKSARAQLEQLRAARDRLIEAYAVVRRTLDEATTELAVAVPEARVAAEAAGRQVEADDDLSVEDIEAELDAGRFAGLPLLDTPSEADVGAAEEMSDDDAVDEAEDQDVEPGVPEDVEPESDEVTDVDVLTDEGADEHDGGATDIFARLRAEVPDDETDDDGGDATSDEAAPEVDEDVEAAAEDDEDLEEGEEEDAPDTLLERRDRVLVPIETKASRLLKRQLADDENDKLDLIRRMTNKDGPEVVLGEAPEHRAPMAEALRKVAVDAAAAGGAFGVELMGEAGIEPADGSDVDVDDLVDEMLDGLLVPIRDKIDELLQGSHDDDAIDGVRACYRQWKGRAGDLAAQLAHDAFNRGVYAGIPDGAPVSWVLDDGAGPCPDGADDALGGAVAKGEPFPTGHLHPPAHPACRCLLVPGDL